MTRRTPEPTREPVRATINPDVLFQCTRSFRDWAKAVAEFVLNGIDWRVAGSMSEIVIRFFKDKRECCVEIVDQSQGADATGRHYLTSFGESRAREIGGMRGQKGSGSKAWMWHCLEVVFETTTEPGTLYRITCTLEKMLAWLFGKGTGSDAWEVTPKLPDHPIRVTGTRVVMRGLGKGKGEYKGRPMVNPKEDRSAERLIRELAECLPPNAHRFVTIVDEDGERHQLEVRKIEGEPIIGEAPGVPAAGDMSWDVAVVANRQTGLDYLRVGALGTYISWPELVRLLRGPRYRTLLEQLEPLGDPHLSGYIEVPGLNEHRSTGSDSFEADLAQNEELVEGMLITLIEQMLSGVRRALKSDRRTTTSDDQTFLAGVVDVIQRATGIVPTTGPTRRVKVTKHTTQIVLEPGDTYEIELNVDPNARVVWDDSASGGHMNPKRGIKGVYSAGQTCGTFTLVARNMADASQVLYKVVIKIVQEIPFAFQRPVYRMDVNDRVRVAIDERAIRHTSGEIVIQIATEQNKEAPTDARLTRDGKRAHEGFVLSGEQQGFLEIEAFDRQNPERSKAKTKVSIEKGFRDRPEREGSPLDLEFVVNGHRFQLASSTFSGSQEAERHVSYLTVGREVSTVTINLDHPVFAGKADDVRASQALWQIAMRVVEHKMPQALVDEAMQEAGMVYVEITHQPVS